MELIQPAEISGKIMTLIDQAKEVIIIVSPYNKFTYWPNDHIAAKTANNFASISMLREYTLCAM